jgi:hypothetical protein
MVDFNEIVKQSSGLTLVERLKARSLNKKLCLILDVSGSMASDVEPGVSKIDALRNIVSGIVGNSTCIEFSTDARVAAKNKISDPHGNTYLSKALILAKDQGFKDCLILTDGDVSGHDKPITLNEAKGMNLQIMYIGAGPRPEFLNELGNIVTTEDLKKPKELTAKIQLLLGAGDETKKESIRL